MQAIKKEKKKKLLNPITQRAKLQTKQSDNYRTSTNIHLIQNCVMSKKKQKLTKLSQKMTDAFIKGQEEEANFRGRVREGQPGNGSMGVWPKCNSGNVRFSVLS